VRPSENEQELIIVKQETNKKSDGYAKISSNGKVENHQVENQQIKNSKPKKSAPISTREERLKKEARLRNENPKAKHMRKSKQEYEETWSCSKCTLINSTKTKICILCGASLLGMMQDSVLDTNNKEFVAGANSPTIFDVPDADSEEMPAKGNVLDRVVQFTAIQMLATERPTSAMQSRTEAMSPTPPGSSRNSANFDRPFSAMQSRSEIFQPTPIVHRIQNNRNYEDENERQNRLSVLEREEMTEILAKWKREHEEREKARKDHFKVVAPKNSVLETQAALLEEAKKRVEQHESAKQKANQLKKEIEVKKQTDRKLESSTKELPKKTEDGAKKPENAKPPTLHEKQASLDSNLATVHKQEPPIGQQSLGRIQSTKFDPTKTPSAFIAGKVENRHVENHNVENPQGKNLDNRSTSTLPGCIDPNPELSKQALRNRRLEYFQSIQTTTSPSGTSKPKPPSEVKKAIEIDAVIDLYDVPTSPPRRVPESFFKDRQLYSPHTQAMPGGKSQQNRSVQHQKKDPLKRIRNASDYEPILCNAKRANDKSSKSAKVVKTPKTMPKTHQQGPINKPDQPPVVSKLQQPSPRLEIKGLRLSGPSTSVDGPMTQAQTQPKRPARNKFRKSQSLEEPMLIKQPIQILPITDEIQQPTALPSPERLPQPPILKPKVLPSTRRVDEIDDMLVKHVQKEEPSMSVQQPQPQLHIQNLSINNLPRLKTEQQKQVQSNRVVNGQGVSKPANTKHKTELMNYQQQQSRLPVKTNSGAIPKAQRTEKTKSFEIVDDVLYISGPIKREVRAKAPSNKANQIDQPLAFHLIPSDKFDPSNTLSRVRQQKNKKKIHQKTLNKDKLADSQMMGRRAPRAAIHRHQEEEEPAQTSIFGQRGYQL
jgi:hypothetical protein